MKTHRLTFAAAAAVIALGAALTVVCAPALARTTRPLLPFSPFGVFGSIGGVGVDQSSGNVYVVDRESNVVDVFGPEGGPPAGGAQAEFSGAQTPQGAFREPGSIAIDDACHLKGLSEPQCAEVDPSNGDIYVQDGVHHVVDKFRLNASSHEYEYVCQFAGYTAGGGDECLKEPAIEFERGPSTVAVDNEGDVYMSAPGGIYEFNSGGVPVAVIASSLMPEPGSIAVDSTGDIYVGPGYGAGLLVELKRSSPTGPVESEVEVAQGVSDVAFDQADDRLLTAVSQSPIVSEYDQSGVLELQFSLAEPAGWGAHPRAEGIAVNETSNNVYVAREGRQIHFGEPSATIEAFGPVAVFPDVTTGTPAESVTETSATVEGSVDPNGLDAHYYCQYGLSASYGSASPEPAADAGSGSVSTPVACDLSGLEPNATYHYRLVASNSNGVTYGEDATFSTEPAAPSVGAQAASGVTLTSAILNAFIDPNNEDTTYRFEYGTSTAYGRVLPALEVDIGSGLGDMTVGELVTGLLPGTTYHFRVVALNATSPVGGTPGPDATFTTGVALLPVVGTGVASEVSQNGASISGMVDPRGLPTSYEFDIGTDTSYGSRLFGEAGSGTQPSTFTLGLQGLAAGTLYHYRLVATNQYGTVYGTDETFTTPVFPTALLAAPIGEPLVAEPSFNPPPTSGAATAGPASKPKAKRRAKQRHRAMKRGARRARRASRPHSDRRSGR